MDKEFVIKQWLKEAGFEYFDNYGVGIHALGIMGKEAVENVAIQLEGPPAFGKAERKPAADEVIVVIQRFPENADELSGEAWVVISLADPDCFYKMDEIIRKGLSFPAKWNFTSLG